MFWLLILPVGITNVLYSVSWLFHFQTISFIIEACYKTKECVFKNQAEQIICISIYSWQL